MFHALPIGVALSKYKDAAFVDVNEAFVRMIGYAREELLGKTSAELGIDRDPKGQTRLLELLRRDGFVHGVESRFHTKLGDARDALININLFESQGETFILSLARGGIPCFFEFPQKKKGIFFGIIDEQYPNLLHHPLHDRLPILK